VSRIGSNHYRFRWFPEPANSRPPAAVGAFRNHASGMFFSLRPQRPRDQEGSCWERLGAAEQAAHRSSGSGDEWYYLSISTLAATPIRRPRTQTGFPKGSPFGAFFFHIFLRGQENMAPGGSSALAQKDNPSPNASKKIENSQT